MFISTGALLLGVWIYHVIEEYREFHSHDIDDDDIDEHEWKN